MLNAKDASQPDFPLSLDVPSSLNPPSSLDPTQRLDVSAYVKLKKVQRPKIPRKAKPEGPPKPKRKSVLDGLRGSYVGKAIEMSGI